MFRDCFDSKIELEVFEENGQPYMTCLSREKAVRLFPEEEVRQAILYYFYYLSRINIRRFTIRVESNSLDIALYQSYPCENLRPSQSPQIIFELKRDNTNLVDCIPQLGRYMKRFNCPNGVLTNSKEILYLNDHNDRTGLSIRVSELEKIINEIRDTGMEDFLKFLLAQQGNLEAFIYLITKFGKTSKFTFTSVEYNVPITCFYFHVVNDFILFDFCNSEPGKKQPKILKSNFRSLISIKDQNI